VTIREQIAERLADGLPHKSSELLKLCAPSGPSALHVHIHYLRKRLHPKGLTVVSIFYNDAIRKGFHYQQIRLVASPSDGRK
jgi:hypothetical protein